MNVIQDGQGNTSSLRVVMLAWFTLLLIGVVYLTIKDDDFPDIPTGLQVITTTILVSKLWQNGQENEQENKNVGDR